MIHLDVLRFVKRNYMDVNFRISENVADLGLTVWLSKNSAAGTLRVHKFAIGHDDLNLDCYDVWLMNLDEAAISLQCECAPIRDGGSLTQNDAIRGWL